MEAEQNDYQKKDIRMYFTSNHDEDRPGWTQEADDRLLLSWRNPQPDTITPYIPEGFKGLPGIARRTGGGMRMTPSSPRLRSRRWSWLAFVGGCVIGAFLQPQHPA